MKRARLSSHPLLVAACRWLVLSILALLFIGLAAGVARGDEAVDVPSVSLAAGEPAPHAGILVSEARIDRAIATAIEAEECSGKLIASERVRSSLTEELASAISSRPEPTVRTERSEWPWVALGFVAGAAAAGLAVWGAVEVMRAR